MADDIIDSRGRFWSAEITVPEEHFAPEESVTGRMCLKANGRIELDLDATIELTASKDAVHRIMAHQGVEGAICGFLIDANKHVRLTRLSSNGGSLGGMGPIRERLIAEQCLVSREPFKPGVEPRFRWLDLPMNGYEPWLGPGNINVTKGKRRIQADYALHSKTIRWPSANMPIELHRDLRGDGGRALTELTWHESAFLRLGFPNGNLLVDEAIEHSERVEDLLVLMADHDKRLDYGLLRRTRNGKPIELYFFRAGRENAAKLEWRNAWVLFEACRDEFGDIVRRWLSSYETYGPGFHLYLGNRRGQAMYPEHRFASLMWGLEALHRGLVPAESTHKQGAKVARILNEISRKKDRQWAARFLPEESEPSLANRLADLFSRVDLGIDKNDIAEFAQRCAARRNDASHFGGQRELGGYEAFLKDIVSLNRAVDLFYHAIILKIVGVPESLVRHRFIGGPKSYVAGKILAYCGLEIPEAFDA